MGMQLGGEAVEGRHRIRALNDMVSCTPVNRHDEATVAQTIIHSALVYLYQNTSGNQVILGRRSKLATSCRMAQHCAADPTGVNPKPDFSTV